MRIAEYINIAILCAASIVLVALQVKPLGFILIVLGVVLLIFCSNDFRKNIALVYGCVILLGLSPINTSTDLTHVIQLGIPMFLVIAAPYVITRYVYKNHLVRFPFRLQSGWKKKELFYFFLTISIGYLLLPIILKTGSSYLNWDIESNTRSLVESFLGLNAVGAWDELFFISTVFGIFRKHLPLWSANMAQAVLFTSFLYNMGFQGWCPIFVYIFALTQGYMYNKTNSLVYVLTVHLTLDVVLHLTLVNLHNSQLVPYFITT